MIMAFDMITAALDIGGKLIDRLWPDPAQAAAAKLELLKMQQTGELAQLTADTELAKGQLAVNQAEAGNENIFVSGWRPFVGWVCGAALANQFILMPMATWLANLFGKPMVQLSIDFNSLSTILFGMLGLGAMRTYEKVKGAQAGQPGS